MNKKYILAIILTIVISFCTGSASMYYYIQSRATYMRYGVFIDNNHDMAKFGVNSGKDYSKENPYNYVPVDWLVKEIEIDSLQEKFKENPLPDVQRVVSLAMSGKYHVYFFSSNITMWYSLSGVEGYCVVDQSLNSVKEWIVLAGFITLMS